MWNSPLIVVWQSKPMAFGLGFIALLGGCLVLSIAEHDPSALFLSLLILFFGYPVLVGPGNAGWRYRAAGSAGATLGWFVGHELILAGWRTSHGSVGNITTLKEAGLVLMLTCMMGVLTYSASEKLGGCRGRFANWIAERRTALQCPRPRFWATHRSHLRSPTGAACIGVATGLAATASGVLFQAMLFPFNLTASASRMALITVLIAAQLVVLPIVLCRYRRSIYSIKNAVLLATGFPVGSMASLVFVWFRGLIPEMQVGLGEIVLWCMGASAAAAILSVVGWMIGDAVVRRIGWEWRVVYPGALRCIQCGTLTQEGAHARCPKCRLEFACMQWEFATFIHSCGLCAVPHYSEYEDALTGADIYAEEAVTPLEQS